MQYFKKEKAFEFDDDDDSTLLIKPNCYILFSAFHLINGNWHCKVIKSFCYSVEFF